MSRFRLLLSTLAPLLLLGSASAADRPPNVVLMIADDHAWTDYSFQNHPAIQTPRIDRLAAESRTFRRGYVPSSLCSPSLASILTGLYAHQHKVTSNDPPLPAGKSNAEANRDAAFLAQRAEMTRFIERVPTLPRLLKQAGYASFQSGKWWGGSSENGGFTEGMTHGDPKRGGRHGDAGLAIGRQTMKPVLDFINGAVAAEQPFFVWYAPMLPHQPHNPPERLLAKYRNKTPSLHVAKYWAMVEWFDETCGAILDHLDQKGIADDTIVIYLADNGWIQDPDAARYAPKSKQSQYDGGLRTPISVRWPGKVQPAEVDQLASSLDIAPTILKAAGLTPTPEMPGIDLLDDEALARRRSLFGEIFTHNAVDIHDPASSLRYRWMIEEDWKLILPAAWNTPDGGVELYNLKADPFETKDLAAEHPDRVAEMTKQIDGWWSPGPR